LDFFRANIDHSRREGQRKAVPSIRHLVASVSDAGAMPVLIILPIHPRLRDDAAPLLSPLNQLLDELAKQHRGIVLNASELLVEGQFADAVHPNAKGRATYSQFVGTRLAEVYAQEHATDTSHGAGGPR
jgi:hypothetical protein